jgi:hypothetical protein
MTRDLKLVNPDLISKVRFVEQRIEDIKQGMGHMPREDVLGDQAARFAEKWR